MNRIFMIHVIDKNFDSFIDSVWSKRALAKQREVILTEKICEGQIEVVTLYISDYPLDDMALLRGENEK